MSQPTFSEINKIAKVVFGGRFKRSRSTDRILRAICENDITAIRGPSSSSKSMLAALYGFCAYAKSPEDTTVAILVDSLTSAKCRIWKNIMDVFCAGMQSGLIKPVAVDSSRCIIRRNDILSSFSGVFASPDQTAVIGIKNKNVVLIIDDFEKGLSAEVVALNVWANPNVKIIVAGNPEPGCPTAISIFSEPEGGWCNLNKRAKSWRTQTSVGGAKSIAVYADMVDFAKKRANAIRIKHDANSRVFKKCYIGRFE